MKYILLAVLMALLIVTPIIVLPRVLEIKVVDCESQFGPCSDIVESTITTAVGKKLFDAKKTLKDVLSNSDKVDSFSISFNLPNKLEVSVVEEKAYAALAKKDFGTFVLIDADANVVGFSEKTQLPIVALDDGVFDSIKEKLVVGENLGDDYEYAAALTNSIYSLYQIRFGMVTEDAIDFKISDSVIKESIIVTFPKRGDVEALVGSLQLILAKVSQEVPIHTIDLRYKNPIVK